MDRSEGGKKRSNKKKERNRRGWVGEKGGREGRGKEGKAIGGSSLLFSDQGEEKGPPTQSWWCKKKKREENRRPSSLQPQNSSLSPSPGHKNLSPNCCLHFYIQCRDEGRSFWWHPCPLWHQKKFEMLSSFQCTVVSLNLMLACSTCYYRCIWGWYFLIITWLLSQSSDSHPLSVTSASQPSSHLADLWSRFNHLWGFKCKPAWSRVRL